MRYVVSVIKTVDFNEVIDANNGLANYNNKDYISFTRTGYTGKVEAEWCTGQNGGGTCFNQDDTSLTGKTLADAKGCTFSDGTCAIPLYVNWQQNVASTITVKFNCNGGTGGGSQVFTAGVANQKFNKTCTRTGYTITSWNTRTDGTGTSYTVSSGVSDSWINTNSPTITLYAIWTVNNTTTNNGMSLPNDSKYFPLDGKNKNGKNLSYLEVDGKYLTEAEMNDINNFIKSSVKAASGWNTKAATAGWALTYGLYEKGLKLHYTKAGKADDGPEKIVGSTYTCKKGGGFCKNWGKYLTNDKVNSYCANKSWGGYVNYSGDCSGSNKKKKKYSGMDCDGFVIWAIINSGCGKNLINGKIDGKFYQSDKKSFPRDTNFSSAKPGDVLYKNPGGSHLRLVIKNNGNGTLLTAEETSVGANGLFFHNYTSKQLKNDNYVIIHMEKGYNKYCAK